MQNDSLDIQPVAIELYGEIRKLTPEEYDRSYESGSGGHEVPPEILAELNGEEPK